MAKTVIISVRVPKNIVDDLKARKKDPRQLVREAILREWAKEIARELNKIGRKVKLPEPKELKKMAREGLT